MIGILNARVELGVDRLPPNANRLNRSLGRDLCRLFGRFRKKTGWRNWHLSPLGRAMPPYKAYIYIYIFFQHDCTLVYRVGQRMYPLDLENVLYGDCHADLGLASLAKS